MVQIKNYTAILDSKPGVEIKVQTNSVTIKGTKGELNRKFTNPRIEITTDGKIVTIRTKEGIKGRQQDKNYVYTYQAHIKNMIRGVTEGYEAKLKICSGHFPMQVTVQDNMLQIKNFLGEKVPRKSKIQNLVKVIIKGDIIEVTGIDKEAVAQTAASIEQLTRITNRDRRIFQDGCYIIQKPGENNAD